jgi:hypothetical protein
MSTSTPTATRSYSTRELQAAAAALAAGRFSTGTPGRAARADRAEEPDATVRATGDRDAAIPTEATAAPSPTDVTGDGSGSTAAVSGLAALVRVRAANAGAGASTIALAIADAADAAGVRARVLDAAAPAWSGLLGATVTELGAADGWRRGRRGDNVLIDRVEDPVQGPAEVPAPRQVDGVDLTVLDAGWSMRELTAATANGTWLATTPARAEVLVTRPHGLALSQTEAALAALVEQLAADQVVVVVVGATRWSDREFAGAGRRLRQAHQQAAVLFTPRLPAKVLPGLGPDPLPKQLTNPSQRLLERITTITGPLTANRT